MYYKNNWYKEDGDVTISNSGRSDDNIDNPPI